MMYAGRRKTKLPRTNLMNLKTVEVPRGRNGYGFTVSGQSPCVLSCILHGSPAEIAGLKAGDSVIAVNGENVTRLSHEQIIKLIGATTGVLRLTVAETDYSESSDDEYIYMPRNRYPHTKRSQSATPVSMSGKPRAEMVVEELQQAVMLDSFTAMHADIPQAMLRGAEVHRIQAEVQAGSSKFAPGHLSPLNKSGNPEVVLKKAQNYDYSYWNGKTFERVNVVVPPKTRKPKRYNDPKNRMFSTPTPTSSNSYYIQENPYDDTEGDMRPLSPIELKNLMYPGSDGNHNAARQMMHGQMTPGISGQPMPQGQVMGAAMFENNENVFMRAMVGYLGSIDIPASANLPTASLHAIRGCVRRLHKEHRVHSFMMMEIGIDAVRLMNSNKRIAVVYPRERLAFSGVCPDDKRFFGIVTTQSPEEVVDTMDSDDEPIGSSCHVFMVDPDFRRHDVHARVTSQFGILCNTNPETNTCDVFPSSAKPILQQVSQLYRDRSDLSYFGELYNQSAFVAGPRRSNSTNSSNSDSGFGNGNGKEHSDLNPDQSQQSAILDVASLMRNKRNNHGATPYNKSTHIIQAEINTSPSDVPYSLSSTSPQSMDRSPQNLYFRNPKDISGRLTPRARPDPIGFRSPSVVQNHESPYHYQQPVRPASVQVPLQSQIQPSVVASFQSRPPQQVETHVQKPHAESSGSSTLEDNSQRSKELMGPPKGLPPSGRHASYARQSVDYPDAAIDPTTAKKVQDELARRLSENQFFHQKQQAQLMRRNSDCSEYSSSTRLSKQALERLQKMRQDPMQLAVHNLQALASSDGDLNQDGRGIQASASNPNLMAQAGGAGGAPELDPTVGRVSSWAVDFERLLSDDLGLACFTEFLKKEFSDENIMFWIACEKMTKITNHQELQRMAQEIYDRHLGAKAPAPVNLDSGARSMVEGAIKNPTPEMFKVQQQQIFKLMKYDSYSRFLKSKLYQDCVLAEMGGLPLPISLEKSAPAAPTGAEPELERSVASEFGGSGGMLEDSMEKNGGLSVSGSVKDKLERKRSDKKQDKKKPSTSETDEEGQEKRRTSILPWRNRTKKSKDSDKHVTSSGNEDTSISSRHSSITSSDFRPAGEKFVDMNRCFHMIFPNNEILTLTPEPAQTLKGILLPLLQERGLGLQNVEIFLNDTKETGTGKQKLINLDQSAAEMIGKQIVVERRVVFKIELPNKRVIGVKSKLTKKIIEVLRPVTYKYKLQLDALVVHLSDSPVPLDLDITVASLDGQRILIETLEQYSAGSYSIGKAPMGSSTQKGEDSRPNSVDTILREDESVRADQSKAPKEKLKSQMSLPNMPTKPLAVFGDTRRDQRALAPPEVKNLPPSGTTGRAEGRRGNLKVTGKDEEDLIAIVSKVQGKRLDDQRGLTLRNLELPDFLKVTSMSTSASSTKPVDSRPKSALALPYSNSIQDASKRGQAKTESRLPSIEALQLRPKSTPPRQNAPREEGDVFVEGILPTSEQAEALFGGGQSPRSHTVRFNDTVVSSTYKDVSWDQRTYVNSQGVNMQGLGVPENSYQSNTGPFMSPDEKLSPRAYGQSHNGGNDSTDYGQNTTAYSLEFNSSFGSTDQSNPNSMLRSASSEVTLPPPPTPPTPDLDVTLHADVADFTPPPALKGGQPVSSQSVLDVRQTPIIHHFSEGCTLPGYNKEKLTHAHLIKREMSLPTQLSFSNNNNTTNVPHATSTPSIQMETSNCYSNYVPFPTTPNGSFYDTSCTTPTPLSQPDVTQVHAKERVIKPPPAYQSSMTSKGAKATFTSSEDLRGNPPPPRHFSVPGNRQGVAGGTVWDSNPAHTPNQGMHIRGQAQGAVHNGPRGTAPAPRAHSVSTSHLARGPAPNTIRAAVPPRPQSVTLMTRQRSSSNTGSGANPTGASKDPKDFQGKETTVISKDGRKVRATFV